MKIEHFEFKKKNILPLIRWSMQFLKMRQQRKMRWNILTNRKLFVDFVATISVQNRAENCVLIREAGQLLPTTKLCCLQTKIYNFGDTCLWIINLKHSPQNMCHFFRSLHVHWIYGCWQFVSQTIFIYIWQLISR